MTTKIVSVRSLRRRWKPHKERLQSEQDDQSTSIRFHRSCSWLSEVEKNTDKKHHDVNLIRLWISFNALYGQWNGQRREPLPDRESWRDFTNRILSLDENKTIANCLEDHKSLVMTVLEDQYLSNYFWKEPSPKRARQSKRTKFNAHDWYREERWIMVLDQILDRIYMLRCQLVHGAATHGGKLNRTSLRHCVMMMQRLLPAFLMVWVEQGADEDWGPMCYPPLN